MAFSEQLQAAAQRCWRDAGRPDFRALARQMNRTHQWVSQIISEGRIPSRVVILELAKALRCDPNPMLLAAGHAPEGEWSTPSAADSEFLAGVRALEAEVGHPIALSSADIPPPDARLEEVSWSLERIRRRVQASNPGSRDDVREAVA